MEALLTNRTSDIFLIDPSNDVFLETIICDVLILLLCAKEEIQKLAGQIEFMRIVSMEMNNRHVKPKPGGYFALGTAVVLQSPRTPRVEPAGTSGGASTTVASANTASNSSQDNV